MGEWSLENLSIRDAVGNYASPIKIGNSSLSEFNINVMGKITVTPGTHNNIFFEAPKNLSNGQSYQLNPQLRSSNAAIPDLNITNDSLVEYTSTNTDLLTVNSSGLLTVPEAAGSGIAILEVAYGEISRQVEIIINEGTIESYLQVSPLTTVLHTGQVQQLKVVEIEDGARKDVTPSSSGVIYSSSDTSIVTVSKDGLIQTNNTEVYGTAEILVKYNDLEVKSIIKVSKPAVKSLTMAPAEEGLSLKNNKLQLVLKAFMTDGTTKDVSKGTEGTKYVSSNPDIAEVSEDGLIIVPLTAKSGEVTITAKNGGVYTKSKIRVDVPELVEINLAPLEGDIYPGQEVQLKASGTWTDGVMKDITLALEGTSYTSSLTSRGKINEDGLLSIPADASYGKVTIYIRNGSVSTTQVFNVVKDMSYELTQMKITAPKTTLTREENTQLTVTGVLGNQSEKDLTQGMEGTTYVSSVPSRATVNENGLVTIPKDASYGDVTISIRNGALLERVLLTVEEDKSKVLQELEAIVDKQNLYREETAQFKVTGVLGDQSEKDLTQGTEGTTYVSSVPSRATVNENGLVTIPKDASYGDVTISIRNGALLERVVLTVKEDQSKVLQELNAIVDKQNLYREETTQFKVTGVLGNQSEKDLTQGMEGTTYVSSVPSRATVNENGLVTIPKDASYGDVTISIRNGALLERVVLTVKEDQSKVLKELNAIVDKQNLYREETAQLTVTGLYGDQTENDLSQATTGTTYVSLVPSRAIVDQDGFITIPPNATRGNVTITIRNGRLRTTLVLTIQ
ncbi:hypothetical protein LCD52_17500 [Rossellomorea vietnamensis]|uniref:hypothetical protein n=1 Tax=Rossellomorea vietnamensis TaxID=218284 RepID=UPI001CCDE6FE|nr:hypothetical protein [Rossellomorea vietnamensis]MCA0150556.1 hypothetical protein [Rossellomorea vietnamensis]